MKSVIARVVLLGAVSAALAGAALADDTVCADPSGTLQYSAWVQDGGPQPQPGVVVETERWVYKGQVLGEQIHHYQQPVDPMPITASFDSQSKVMLEQRDAGPGPKQATYAIRVAVKRVDGQAIDPAMGLQELDTYLICNERVQPVP